MNLLVWDFDGTLGYCDGLWSGVFAHLLATELPGLIVDREQIADALQTGFPWHDPHLPHTHLVTADDWWSSLDEVLRNAFASLGVPPDRCPDLAALVRPYYCSQHRWQLFPDTIACLDQLSAAGWRHIVLSNHVPELPQIIAGLGIHDRFDRIVNSAVTGYEKPHPLAFAKAIEGLPEIERHWMIGDSFTADFEGAVQAGWPAILVRRHHDTASPFFDSLEQLPAFLNATG
ncbi:MAG: family hydrolase [Akkermansiaceae bacterium]|nr:family hydrolase [Akkermansiaceae bacterium]